MNDIPQKYCTKCGNFFPATGEYFHRDIQKKDGLRNYCKECTRSHVNAHQNKPEIRDKRRTYMSGYNHLPTVEERRPAYQKSYLSRPGVRDRILAQKKEYKSRSEVQAYRQKQNKVYRNRPEVQERMRNYIRPRARIYSGTRRARKKAVLGTHTPAQIQEQLKRQKYRCYYAACGHAKFKRVTGKYIYHIDHTFPLSRIVGSATPANDISYLVLACPTCNISKHDKFPWEFPEGGRLL